MTDITDNQDEAFQSELRSINPYVNATSNNPVSIPSPAQDRQALFEEITLVDPGSASPVHTFWSRPPSGAASNRTPWFRSWRLAPALAGVVALIAASTLVASTVAAPSAEALIREAARNTFVAESGLESGSVTATITFRQVPNDDRTGFAVLSYRFEGEDRHDVSDYRNVIVGGANSALLDSWETIVVDGGVFHRWLDEDQYREGLVLADANIEPSPTGSAALAAVLALIEGSQGFEQGSTSGPAVTYRGTLASDVLLDLRPDEIPMELFHVAGLARTADQLPDLLGVEVTVANDRLAGLAVEIKGETAEGPADIMVAIAYEGFGEPQGIVAPLNVAQMPDGLPDLEEVGRHLENSAVFELEERRPGLCSNFALGSYRPFNEAGELTPEAYLAGQNERADCLDSEGEPAAAAEIRANAVEFGATPKDFFKDLLANEDS